MKIKASQADVLVQGPPVGRIISVVWVIRDFRWQLVYVEPEHLMKNRLQNKGLKGKPHMFAFSPLRATIYLYPIPHEDGELVVRYYPEAVEV